MVFTSHFNYIAEVREIKQALVSQPHYLIWTETETEKSLMQRAHYTKYLQLHTLKIWLRVKFESSLDRHYVLHYRKNGVSENAWPINVHFISSNVTFAFKWKRICWNKSSSDSNALLTRTNASTPKAKYFSQENQCILTQANKIPSKTKYCYYNQYISPGTSVTLLKPTQSHWNSKLKLDKRLQSSKNTQEITTRAPTLTMHQKTSNISVSSSPNTQPHSSCTT